jgi:ComF family protein
MSAAIKTILGNLGSLAKSAGDLLLPQVCLACQGDDVASQGLCSRCLQGLLTLVGQPYCLRCGANGQSSTDDRGCPSCPDPLPRFDRLVRLGPYEPPIKELVRQFKYHRRDGVGRHLGALLATAVSGQCPQEQFDLVLCIPTHWRRRIWRSFDHARSLSSVLAKHLNLPMGYELVRMRHTPPQAQLPKTRRIQNVRGAFAVGSQEALSGAKILLVDDVTTTGATANEATRTLLDAGASRVVLAVIAKAQPPMAYSHAKD